MGIITDIDNLIHENEKAKPNKLKEIGAGILHGITSVVNPEYYRRSVDINSKVYGKSLTGVDNASEVRSAAATMGKMVADKAMHAVLPVGGTIAYDRSKEKARRKLLMQDL